MSLHIHITPAKIPQPAMNLYRIVWDDENPDYGFKCRTQSGSWTGPDNPPAVMRYYPIMREKAGEFPVDLSDPYDWKPFVIRLNDNDEHKFYYWCGKERAQFNKNGWPMFQNVGMSGNTLQGEQVGNWFRFETLKPSDLSKAWNMSRVSHSWFIHTFTCVTWDARTRTTKHIFSTGTPVGSVDYPLVTNEGFAYIPLRHVVKL